MRAPFEGCARADEARSDGDVSGALTCIVDQSRTALRRSLGVGKRCRRYVSCF